jgi:Arm DNA-binding domain
VARKELQIRNIRPTDKVIQCTDDQGLYLEVHPNGSKLWRYKYRYMGNQKRLALGRYPDIGLADARRRRDDARRQLEAGSDPLAKRKHEKPVAEYTETSVQPRLCGRQSAGRREGKASSFGVDKLIRLRARDRASPTGFS